MINDENGGSVKAPAIYIVRKISWFRISHESVLYIDFMRFFEFLYRKPLLSIISCILRKVNYLRRNFSTTEYISVTKSVREGVDEIGKER